MIYEIDFENLKQYKGMDVIPVFMQFKNECYEIVANSKNVDNSWAIFQKIFYYNFYIEKHDYIDSLLDKKLFANKITEGTIIFSNSDKTFNNQYANIRDTAVKFATDVYTRIMPNKYNYLVVLKRVLIDTNFDDFKLYVTTKDDLEDSNFKKEYVKIKKLYSKKKKYKVKKGNFVSGHINGLILTEQEKLIKYVRNEFKKKNLIGDIILTESQEKILNEYMANQLKSFISNPTQFKPEYGRVFALGLVRYAMRHYNTRGTGDFWPYFETDFGVAISSNKQKDINNIFMKIMDINGMIYDNLTAQKIDNITMHSFVADHSANQLFDYLFDFWRLDLGRNTDNLNSFDKGDSSFNALIEAIRNGAQNVMNHTSLLLNFDKTKASFKNRLKRILKLINEAFWNDTAINETGNRINHLLNIWIENPKGSFQKEKNYVAKHNSKDKGETLFHSPVFSMDYDNEKLSIILPHQRLVNCNENDNPVWKIICSNNEFESLNIQTNEHYKHDKIGCYVEKMSVEIPIHLMLSGFELTLCVNEREEKKYKLPLSKIRLFDSKGKYVDYKNVIIPEGYVTSYSDNKKYPEIIGEETPSIMTNGLNMKCFNLTKGQILVVEDLSGVQIGQKLSEGLNEFYPIEGAELFKGDCEYKIYSKLPKLMFKASNEQINGVSLVINGKQNKVVDNNLQEFKISKELKASGYLIDLNDYIKQEGLYSISLGFPKMHKMLDIAKLAYIENFNYEFLGAPYIFKDFGKIKFASNVRIDKNIKEKDGYWISTFTDNTLEFNFGDRNPNSENYCSLIEENKLVLNCILGNIKYPVKFDIPALYWKFSLEDEWNTRQPANILLKDLKTKIKRLYVMGPFNFNNASIITTNDVDIAEEESEIHLTNGKNSYFEIEKIYNWFKNDRSEVYRSIFISFNERTVKLCNVVCKSKLNDVNLFGDFEQGILSGTVDIEGNENYTISIYHNNDVICEDEQVINNQFSFEANLSTGDYEIYVYEIVESDDDGFDIGTESICLNSKAIIKKLINLNDLVNNQIILKGYQDLNKKLIPHNFANSYVIRNLERTTYSSILEKEPNAEFYGIWNENINIGDINEMNSYIIYSAKLGVTSKYDDSFKYLTKVYIIFIDKMKFDSMIILAKDSDDEYGGLLVDKSKEWIVPAFQYKDYNRFQKRKCEMLYDDHYFYISEIEEV